MDRFLTPEIGMFLMQLSKSELIQAGYQITQANVEDLSLNEIWRWMTITQYVTDACLNEIERRGELTFSDGLPLVPYQCEYMLETILTRRRR